MRIKYKFILILIVILSIVSCQHSKDSDLSVISKKYFEQKAPQDVPELFAPGIISTGMSELNSVFSPDGKDFYFSVLISQSSSIFRKTLKSDKWSEPEQLSFASQYGDVDISLSPDGKRLFFCSRRPTQPKDSALSDHDIWMCLKKGDSWEVPVNLGLSVNSAKDDFYPTTAKNGNLYFNSQREGQGTNNIYVSKFIDNNYTPAEILGPEVNIGAWNFDPVIDPDERFLIFASNKSDGFGATDLYISFHKTDGSWTIAKNLGPQINSSGSEFSPTVSPDGKYLFFTSSRIKQDISNQSLNYSQFVDLMEKPMNGNLDIYWVSAKFIETLGPK